MGGPDGTDDPYATLGIPHDADDDEVTRAYRRLARAHHPDANPAAAGAAFSGLTDAYDVLRDPARRRAYDRTRRARVDAATAAGVEIPVRREPGPRRVQGGPAADLELRLTFEQAALGATVAVDVETDEPCQACGGRGVTASPCHACGGAGSATRTSGGISIRRVCSDCGGEGSTPSPCAHCHGSRRHSGSRRVKIRVPAGVDEGTTLRAPVTAAGDGAVAVVRVERHPYFARQGRDVTVRLPVTLAEAALGAVVTVPTLTGAVAMRVPAGTRPGRTFRVRGRGIPFDDGPSDLLVTVDVVIPERLNDGQRAALEAFARETESPRRHFEAPPTNSNEQ